MDVEDLKINLEQYLKPEVNSFGGLIDFVLNNMLFFGGLLVIFAALYTGIMYITAGGDVQKATRARANFIYIIIGLVLILLAASIVSWVPKVLTNTLIEK